MVLPLSSTILEYLTMPTSAKVCNLPSPRFYLRSTLHFVRQCPTLQNYTTGLPDDLQAHKPLIFCSLMPTSAVLYTQGPTHLLQIMQWGVTSNSSHILHFLYIYVYLNISLCCSNQSENGNRTKNQFQLALLFFKIQSFEDETDVNIFFLHEFLYHFKGGNTVL